MHVTVAHEPLAAFASAVMRHFGLPPADAALVADSLVQADLWGHSSHGVMRLFWYADRLASGAMRARTAPTTLVDTGALVLLDGGDGVGQVVAMRAMELAVERARLHGIGAVSVRNSGHFGTAMYYTRRAAEASCIGFLTTNASPSMPPHGGREKRLGNNPWSIAAPVGPDQPPMLLDIANTAVARGKLFLARQKGAPIPLGWAIDTDGAPTTDPVAGIAGAILPMAGHKGYGVTLMMDVLAGVLSGSEFGGGVTGPYMPEGRSGAGHFAFAVDITRLRPIADFEADMARLVGTLKTTPRAPDVEEILYPGEPETRAEALHRKTGIAIPDATATELRERGASIGIPAPF